MSAKNICVKKILFRILVHVFVKIEKYLASIMDDSVITCDEIREETITTNLMKRKKPVKCKNFYILPAFLLITISLLIAVSIYCHLIKYRAKQKHLLPFHNINDELKQKHLLSFHNANNELRQILLVI